MINQEELIQGTLKFLNSYKRLPCLKEDDIEIEKLNDEGETEMRSYRSLKYIKEYFGNHEKYTEYLLENKILTYEKIAECVNIPVRRLKELLKGDIGNIEVSERHVLDIFFNYDLYSHLGMMCKYCSDCTKRRSCGQDYWVRIIHCPRYNKRKEKK